MKASASFVTVALCVAGGLFLHEKIERLETTVSKMHRLESEFQQATIKHLELIEQRERIRNDSTGTLRYYGRR
jgi:hypothetical protein